MLVNRNFRRSFAIGALPSAVKLALPPSRSGHWLVSFTSPTPECADYLGRNHPFVAALARFLLEEALHQGRRCRRQPVWRVAPAPCRG